MIVTREKLKEVTGVDYYDGSVIHSRFAYKFFRDKVHPVGNIIVFASPTKVESEFMLDLEDVISKDYIYSESMVNIIYELPCTNLWGGVAFQRLYNTYLGDILSDIIKAPVQVEGDDIFVARDFINKDKVVLPRGKASVSIVTEKQGAILGHTGINIVAGNEAPSFAYSTNMTPAQATAFEQKCIEVFYQTAQSIFTATTKVI